MASRDASSSVLQVYPFEAKLLRILRYFFQQIPAEEALPLVRSSSKRPVCLSASAVHLVRDTLAKGCVLNLVRAGGWKLERFLRAGEPVSGRLWQRRPLDQLKLEFSRHSLEFLIWLTANSPTDTATLPPAPAEERTVADQFLFYLAYRSLREEADLAEVLHRLPIMTENVLCRLMFPGDFADVPSVPVAFFDAWMTDPASTILEAMQTVLAARWLDIENAKGQIVDWQRMRQQGESEFAVLGEYLAAAERSQRRDLACFLLHVLGKLLATPDMAPTFWTGALQVGGPMRLAERLEIQRFALSTLREAGNLRQWEQRARSNGYFDEEYAASKFWLGEWERLGAAQSIERAERIVRTLEPLQTSDV